MSTEQRDGGSEPPWGGPMVPGKGVSVAISRDPTQLHASTCAAWLARRPGRARRVVERDGWSIVELREAS